MCVFFFPVIYQMQLFEDVWGDSVPPILNRSTRWMWLVSFIPNCITRRGEDCEGVGGREGPRAGLDVALLEPVPPPPNSLYRL